MGEKKRRVVSKTGGPEVQPQKSASANKKNRGQDGERQGKRGGKEGGQGRKIMPTEGGKADHLKMGVSPHLTQKSLGSKNRIFG